MSTALSRSDRRAAREGPRRGRRSGAPSPRPRPRRHSSRTSWLLSRDEPAALFAERLPATRWSSTPPARGGPPTSSTPAAARARWMAAGRRDPTASTLRCRPPETLFIEARQRIDHPKVDPEVFELLGSRGAHVAVLARRPHDHRVRRQGQVYPEVRGEGMGEAASFRTAEPAGSTARQASRRALPEEFVTAGEANEARAAMLRGIRLAPGGRVPSSGKNHPYQLGPTWHARSSARGSPSSPGRVSRGHPSRQGRPEGPRQLPELGVPRRDERRGRLPRGRWRSSPT